MTVFRCERCAACCRWGGYVYITERDVAGMSLYLKMDAYEFVNKYAEIVHRPRLNLRSGEGGGCVFLEGNSCAVYPARPKQCADFPEVWRIKELESFCLGEIRAKERSAGRP